MIFSLPGQSQVAQAKIQYSRVAHNNLRIVIYYGCESQLVIYQED